MKSSRCCFAAICIQERFIYVYGGIVGNVVNSIKPIMSSPIVEKYDVNKDSWETINIKNSPTLAAFGWGQG